MTSYYTSSDVVIVPYTEVDSCHQPAEYFNDYLADNTGNMAFMFATPLLVTGPVYRAGELDMTLSTNVCACTDEARRFNGNGICKFCSRGPDPMAAAAIIYPCANLLRPIHEYESIPQIQEQTKWLTLYARSAQHAGVPFLTTSLGVEGHVQALHPDQIELLRALHDNCGCVCVRGSTTASLAELYIPRSGIAVVGCPSTTMIQTPPTLSDSAYRIGLFIPPMCDDGVG
jgi:hypothetical protein